MDPEDFREIVFAKRPTQCPRQGIPYSDYGTWSMNGWHQIFFYDPEGNVIEVHEAQE